MHEQIENEYIIGLLQQRCNVHNVHSDNKLSEMLTLFEKGLHNVKVLCVDVFILFFVLHFFVLFRDDSWSSVEMFVIIKSQ